MPNQADQGFVDYVLWGDDCKPPALVEAKRSSKDPMLGQQQARLYADALEQRYGQRPLIFLSAAVTGSSGCCFWLTAQPWCSRPSAFRRFLPDCAPVNLVINRGGEGRVFLSTYPTMMNLIDAEDGHGVKRFGVGHFDLVIIDEAHRSVYQKYCEIFSYFDSLLSGLTATPRYEIDRNTYELFDLDVGLPTDEYGLDQAIADGFLVPYQAISVALKFPREGIRYADLSEEEKARWDLLDWEEGVLNNGFVD